MCLTRAQVEKKLLLGINKSRKLHMALHVHVEKTRLEPLTRALCDWVACNVFFVFVHVEKTRPGTSPRRVFGVIAWDGTGRQHCIFREMVSFDVTCARRSDSTWLVMLATTSSQNAHNNSENMYENTSECQ